MQDRVAFLGFRTDARDLIQIADVVVLSSDREGFPLVMVEALQANKTMASTRVNGVIEWLPEPYLANIGQAKELQQAIENALTVQAQGRFLTFICESKARVNLVKYESKNLINLSTFIEFTDMIEQYKYVALGDCVTLGMPLQYKQGYPETSCYCNGLAS